MKAELIETMGDDLRVVNAARVSFDKESGWVQKIKDPNDFFPLTPGMVCYATEEVLSEKDQKLLNYLANHGHWTPFSHVMITMRETVPLFVRAQRMKHFVGFNLSGENDHEGLGMTYNEVSRRYVSDEPEFYVPDSWRKAAENKKQGSSDEEITWISNEEWEGDIKADYEKIIDDISCLYRCMIDSGVAPEQARMILPQSMMTSYYVTGSLSSWARAYKLRNDSHSQKEIRDLAEQWGEIISSIPSLQYSWKALTQ